MKLKLKQKTENAGVSTFLFEPEQPLTWQPGQFMTYLIPNEQPDDRGIRRFFSISTAPFEGLIGISTRIPTEKGSTFKQALNFMLPGQEIEATGPSGDFVLTDLTKKYVFIAGGIGITPFRSIILELAHKNTPVDIKLLYANRNTDVPFNDEFDQLSANNFPLTTYYIIDPAKIDAETIKKDVPDFLERIFYISGPEPMVEAMEKIVAELGVADENIHRDYFPGYTEI